jgi:membrane protease YdiL (CAAX protease family)
VARQSALNLGALPHGLLVLLKLVIAGLAYLVALSLTSLLTFAIGQTIVPDQARGVFGLIGLGVAEAAALGSILVVWRRLDGQPLVALGLDPAHAARRWLRGAAIATLMMGFIVFVNFTLLDGATWDMNSSAGRAALALLGGLIGYAVQGPAEELLFRGYILVNVRKEWGLRPAIVASSLGFALVHIDNPAFGVLPFVNLLLFGLAMALYRVYVDDDQLWGVFGIHTLWNWLQQVVFGLPNSGFAAVPDFTLFTVTPNTAVPGFFWGSGFGPEGTLAASLALLALIAGCIHVRRPASPAATGPPRSSGRRRVRA